MEIAKKQPRLWHILIQFSISGFGEYGAVLYNKWYQMIELLILLQMIQVLTPGSRHVEWDLKFYWTVLYIATMLHLTVEPRGRPVASNMYHIIFI